MPSSASKSKKKRAKTDTLDHAITRLRDGEGDGLALVEAIALTEKVMSSMHEVFSLLDATILREFGAIANSIARAKEDIGRLQPQELSSKRIPQAGLELAAVVEATEGATHQIMEAAERMLAIEAEDLDSYRAQVEAEVMGIFEACSFQDITGQRVNKVVETLQDIDDRVTHIASTLGVHDTKGAISEREAARDARKKEQILNGPALEGEGSDQDEIDRLLGEGTGGQHDQDAIDALFD